MRRSSVVAVLLVALIATLSGALLGWGVLRLKGGAQAFTLPPPRLSLVQRAPGQTDASEMGGAAAQRRMPARRHQGNTQRSNPPDSYQGALQPRLAIVIDDIGQTLLAPRELVQLPVPVTFSVLPDLPHSRGAAAMIAQKGREFIIHLPMQPLDYPVHDPGPSPLLLSLDERETRQRLNGYLREFPDAIGASNHMGSAYTADPERMAIVQQVLAERNLFFLNSKTSATPVPAAIAREGQYAYLERDVFLDNDRDRISISRALDQAFARARHRGHAIAIGHPYPETIQVLQTVLTTPSVEGVQLVPLSDLLPR